MTSYPRPLIIHIARFHASVYRGHYSSPSHSVLCFIQKLLYCARSLHFLKGGFSVVSMDVSFLVTAAGFVTDELVMYSKQ